MAKKLTNDSKVTENTIFLLDTDVQNGVTYTQDQYDDAVSYYRAKVSKTDKGRVPINKAFNAWFDAGMPKINSDDIRKERLAVSEGAGRSWEELTDEQYAEYKANWEDAGSPEPLDFLPKHTSAKIIGRVLVDGKETEDTLTVYVPTATLAAYRDEHGITGPSGYETYLASVEDQWKGVIAPTLLKTPQRVQKLDNGKPVTRTAALKAELNAALADAIATGDMSKLMVVQERLNAM